MKRATFTRTSQGAASIYLINPLGMKIYRLIVAPIMIFIAAICLSLIVYFILGLFFWDWHGKGSNIPLLGFVLTAGAIAFFGWRGIRAGYGSRIPSRIVVDPDKVTLTRGKVTSSFARASLRRLQLRNTLTRFESTTAFVTTAQAAFAENMKAALYARQSKICWSLVALHDNEVTVLSDGLDGTTADNISADLSRDLNLG